MDAQHFQGEGVPAQAGKGQRCHRPDQRYLSLHPPTVSFCLSQRTTKQEAGKQIDPGRKNPLESGWPADCLGFQIKGDYFKKIQEGFCGDTRAFWTKDSCWLKQGGRGTWGGLDLPGSCLTKRQSQRRSAGPVLQRLPLQPPPLRISHEWAERADVCVCVMHRHTYVRFLLDFLADLMRGQKDKGLWLSAWTDGDGLSISSAKRTSYRGRARPPLSFCCLNVFTFLSVNIKDFYCAF